MSEHEHGSGLRAWREWSDSLASDGWEDRVAPFDTCPWRLIEAALEREARIPVLVAAALEQAALKNEVCRVCGDLTNSEPLPFCERTDPDHTDDDDCAYQDIATAIRALTTADARAALDAMLAKAREDGRIEESFTIDKKNARFLEMLAAARAEGVAEGRMQMLAVATKGRRQMLEEK